MEGSCLGVFDSLWSIFWVNVESLVVVIVVEVVLEDIGLVFWGFGVI